MGPVTEGILIGAGGLVAFALLSTIAALLIRMSHVPKRVDRLEAAVPIMLRGLMSILDGQIVSVACIQAKKCNGELEDLIETDRRFKQEIQDFLAGKAISQKPSS